MRETIDFSNNIDKIDATRFADEQLQNGKLFATLNFIAAIKQKIDLSFKNITTIRGEKTLHETIFIVKKMCTKVEF